MKQLQCAKSIGIGTVAVPIIIIHKTLKEDATCIVLSHNHPWSNQRPSRADEELTKKITEAARYFDIKVFGHIIVSKKGYYSFAD